MANQESQQNFNQPDTEGIGATQRLAYSPSEFAAFFGKEQTWAYRKIYAGKIKVIKSFGNMMIPATEVERILNSAEYAGVL